MRGKKGTRKPKPPRKVKALVCPGCGEVVIEAGHDGFGPGAVVRFDPGLFSTDRKRIDKIEASVTPTGRLKPAKLVMHREVYHAAEGCGRVFWTTHKRARLAPVDPASEHRPDDLRVERA